MSIPEFYFGWPHGAVWSNLLASAICTAAGVGLAWWRLHRQSLRQHAEQLAQAARHHKELMTQAAVHHQELKAHVSQQLMLRSADIKEHVSAAVADAQASAGPGSNPGQSEGLKADQPAKADPPLGGERVIPPAATTRKPRR